MTYGYVYVAVCVSMVAIGIFVIFQQESKQSEQSNSIPSIITSQNPTSSAESMIVPHGHPVTNQSFVQSTFTTQIVPDQITLTRGGSAYVTVNLDYKYFPGSNTPKQLVVYMTPQHNALTGPLKIWANLTDEQLANRIDAYDANGTSPPGMYNTTQLESYPNPGPILVNANETKQVIMRITIPPDYPVEFLNKGIHLNAIANASYPHLGGYMGGVIVIVTS